MENRPIHLRKNGIVGQSPSTSEENVEVSSNASIMNLDASFLQRYRVQGIEEYSMTAGWGKDLRKGGASLR